MHMNTVYFVQIANSFYKLGHGYTLSICSNFSIIIIIGLLHVHNTHSVGKFIVYYAQAEFCDYSFW